ncbi:MAG TPA: folylpolyglutamate synthase/dihydrofolate synthase family protein [Acetobacteraceae bacterium]|nr:folylpolyglutamate synthase/dihydrofolate synthase family protein [Acetobacteraceae bacterium]
MSGRSEAIIERLHSLYPRLIDLTLGRLEHLLDALGNPERRLPPVIHVAGTNGKGSTCAFLRAIAESAGLTVHVYTSPHLVRFTERIRLAGELVSDAVLADTLEEIERVNAGAPVTVFEVLVAAAYLLFTRVPADLCIVEVGLGGRYDATNVVAAPVATAITSISLDHQDFLGDTLGKIAWEKAGIAKRGVPLIHGAQEAEAAEVIAACAAEAGAPVLARGRDWDVAWTRTGMRFSDAHGTLDLPAPSLPGPYQLDNAGIALAAIRASGLALPAASLAGIARAEWPARMQRLDGVLARMLPEGWELWLDGGHNAGAGVALAEHMARWDDRPLHLIVGMKKSKDAAAFLRPLLPHAASVWAVVEPGQHLALPVADVIAASGGVARPGPTIAETLPVLRQQEAPGRVLICGSLYLAGEVLKADAGLPPEPGERAAVLRGF